MSTRRDPDPAASTGLPSADQRRVMASLIDEVSNRLQVILGYAQILHELDDDEREAALRSIEQESESLRGTLRSLTGLTRDPDGNAPWDQPALD